MTINSAYKSKSRRVNSQAINVLMCSWSVSADQEPFGPARDVATLVMGLHLLVSIPMANKPQCQKIVQINQMSLNIAAWLAIKMVGNKAVLTLPTVSWGWYTKNPKCITYLCTQASAHQLLKRPNRHHLSIVLMRKAETHSVNLKLWGEGARQSSVNLKL